MKTDLPNPLPYKTCNPNYEPWLTWLELVHCQAAIEHGIVKMEERLWTK